MVSVVNGMTGWDIDINEIFAVGQRTATMARIFNLREGLDASTDTLPKRFFEPFRNDNSATGRPMDPEATHAALKWHYKRNGWDENGVPTTETLKALGIDQYADALAAKT
jgi:aldehyde:ferredoxin oxidoreductase